VQNDAEVVLQRTNDVSMNYVISTNQLGESTMPPSNAPHAVERFGTQYDSQGQILV
jgi:hypothetical protein